ncbi:ribosome recycling factor [Clostridium acetobutylicum]|uniref:Ribosome-recycling factor n=1 Tax=Clostridium acetobutylicum (strain ATCC 824 / DSM 792 / JCM 1419 / IAM 19013 / LMG 5710 / NBRC 13948 / NRRL B-527 / VKM B-1787 / 2291 / W) TaxID=272562 RepID=RRF_CLOAB|nr:MULTISPECIES: ribosome recycling factor [Clostridium]Q97I63.1 RecName: Full=Ribosome-recycling factor; Short=RRF; AltName: Full=Ribosome-releasing factor [Clostridium acetobutylicum ATCC 824]AAK79755.1 Ribosome recycling factor [Clostridium acetobutylicum ATCC 824]ADZ20840.1 ribosome recycling factor [Clostridium acetobutylicum EA 2018]AEI33793.1 ribosome recycling factor [Clostridium acetobutylicum DSM 1731]AWV79810.1 ribosome recycling factor [Clostridium acetobutylicum]KHD38081.1 riboso
MISDIIKELEEKMTKSISALKKELTSMKAGRANPAMLDRIEVDYYGTMTPLNQLANISVPESRVLMIQPWDKSAMKSIEKAILISDLGLNPSNDGTTMRLVIPELTEETRKNIVKNVKKAGEDGKVALRAIRRDANDKVKSLKKDNSITEDEMKSAENDIQKKTDSYVKEIDKMVEAKEKEIMSI